LTLIVHRSNVFSSVNAREFTEILRPSSTSSACTSFDPQHFLLPILSLEVYYGTILCRALAPTLNKEIVDKKNRE
jgi:hypothetical protein